MTTLLGVIRCIISAISKVCIVFFRSVLPAFVNRSGSEGKESQRQTVKKGWRRPTWYRQLWVLLLRRSRPLHVGAPGTRWDRKWWTIMILLFSGYCSESNTDSSLFSSEGATRSHLDLFKKHRAARIDHYVIEVNKLMIRLEKVRLSQPTRQL